jgi:integrase
MRVQRTVHQPGGRITYDLLDAADQPIPAVSGFLRHLTARDYSPNTLAAYAYDLLRLTQFLAERSWTYHDFTPARSLDLLEYLRHLPSHRPAQRLDLVLCTTEAGQAATRLSPTTINRVFAAVSSFYEYLIVSDQFAASENPIQQRDDLAQARVSEQHRPFLSGISRPRPVRRVVRVKTVQHLPRPLSDTQVAQLLGSLRCERDKAMILLMLQGGLRPGEVLTLHLEDIQYGRRRVIIRYRTDHPKGSRTKSRTERVVDLLEPETLQAVSTYVLQERPPDVDSPFVFLVGGAGGRRHEPLSYQALVKLFQRHCARLGIREPWLTPHALRHTHATRMWEGGMRELTLQKRLGHASPEATRLYTRVSDPVVVAEYRRALGGETDQ